MTSKWMTAMKEMDDEVALTLHAMDIRVSELAPSDEVFFHSFFFHSFYEREFTTMFVNGGFK